MEDIKVLLIEQNSYDREHIAETLSKVEHISLIGIATDDEEAERLISDEVPHVIIIGTNLEQDRYQLAESISADYRNSAIIMIEDELKEDTMFKTISSGAKDVIITPFTSGKLVDSIYRAAQLMKEEIHQERQPVSPRVSGRKIKGHVITVFSTKGGVGKTFVTTNLAVSLARNTGKSVCIIDLDLDFGNVALALNVTPKFTILDIVDDIRNVDQDVVESYLIPHDSGIMVLPANARPQINEFINAEHVEIILKALKGAFDYVIVDMPSRFYEPVNPAFQEAAMLLMVSTPEISAVRNIKASIESLHELSFPKAKLKVVLNKANSTKDINIKDVENTLSQSLYGVIAFDAKLATYSLNNGVPVTMAKPRSEISKSFTSLALKIDSDLIGTKG